METVLSNMVEGQQAEIGSLLQQQLWTYFPLAQHMKIKVLRYEQFVLELMAPLAHNTNLHSSAFGGSISSIALLAGWGLLHAELMQRDISAEVVIQKVNMEYLLPIYDDFIAKCSLKSLSDFNRFVMILQRKGMARIKLSIAVCCQGKVAANFQGSFVAKTK